jgi:hypothetical protein
MANSNHEKLLDNFNAIQGQDAGNGQSVQTVTEGLVQALNDAAAAASGTVHEATSSATASGDGGVSAGSVVKTVLESGFGLVSLISGLMGLFGGGDSSTPPPLVKYAMPAALDIETAWTPTGMTGADYDQMGMPRAYSGASAAQTGANAGGSAGGSSSGPSSGSSINPGAAPQITVNVQAMDARSFLDRSGDIAAAVRNAMLNLNSINDVVNDL